MAITGNIQNISSLKINGKELQNILDAMQARQNSITSAISSENLSDYDGELIDARADTFGQSHENIGNNIRANQAHFVELQREHFSITQSQIDVLTNAVFSILHFLDTHLTNTKGD